MPARLRHFIVKPLPEDTVARWVASAELCGEVRQQGVVVQVAFALLEHEPAKRIVAESHEDRSEIAEKLVKGRRFAGNRLVVMRPQPVEHGMAELVVDDVARQAGVDRPLSGR